MCFDAAFIFFFFIHKGCKPFAFIHIGIIEVADPAQRIIANSAKRGYIIVTCVLSSDQVPDRCRMLHNRIVGQLKNGSATIPPFEFVEFVTENLSDSISLIVIPPLGGKIWQSEQ